MKIKLTFLLSLTFLFLFSGSVYGDEEVKREYWGKGKLKRETHFKNGKRQLDIWFYETSKKMFEVHVKNRRAEGLRTTWFESGKKKSETHFKNGQRDGLEIRWYPSGIKISETHYKDGKLHGLRRRWLKDGNKKRDEHYKDGKLHGLTTVYLKDGTKINETIWKDGKKDFKIYRYKNGNKKRD